MSGPAPERFFGACADVCHPEYPKGTVTMSAPKSPRTSWPDALVRVVPLLRHYLGAALLVLIVGLLLIVARANELHLGPVHISRTR